MIVYVSSVTELRPCVDVIELSWPGSTLSVVMVMKVAVGTEGRGRAGGGRVLCRTKLLVSSSVHAAA